MIDHIIQPIVKNFIDSCIYLETVIEGYQKKDCSEFLDRIGYKNRNLGILTVFIIGEVYCGIFKSIENIDARRKSSDFLDLIISRQLKENKIDVITFKEGDFDRIERIMEIDNRISYDDAIHLSNAIQLGCKIFTTIDAVMLNKETVERLWKEFRIKMRHPNE